jgi:hypothetical protein
MMLASMPEEHGRWLARDWIRVASEELAHVVQVLYEHSGSSPHLSQMMIKHPTLNYLVTLKGQEIESVSSQRFAEWAFEVDVYAYLYDILGSEMMPYWIGHDSGYDPRELVDEELTEQGVPNREWQKMEIALPLTSSNTKLSLMQ